MAFFRDDPVTTLLAWALLAALLDVLPRLARRNAPPETPASQGGLIFFDRAALIGLAAAEYQS